MCLNIILKQTYYHILFVIRLTILKYVYCYFYNVMVKYKVLTEI